LDPYEQVEEVGNEEQAATRKGGNGGVVEGGRACRHRHNYAKHADLQVRAACPVRAFGITALAAQGSPRRA
jgi:hypothetical protein